MTSLIEWWPTIGLMILKNCVDCTHTAPSPHKKVRILTFALCPRISPPTVADASLACWR